ncbi:MAG: Rdx family protein [Chloroflexi bacterium]|nr:Rdx family protein [Chloroflexota bacterium]
MPGRIEITYCRKCRFMLRAAWLAQELLTTFEEDLSEVAIKPSSGGIFEVALDGETIATNRETKRMPETSEVKRLVRDRLAPERRIGHE